MAARRCEARFHWEEAVETGANRSCAACSGRAKGFAAGVGIGLFSAVALPVTGVVNGGRQIVRGMANTLDAVNAQHQGKIWDSGLEKWVPYVPYNLQNEAAELLQSARVFVVPVRWATGVLHNADPVRSA